MTCFSASQVDWKHRALLVLALALLPSLGGCGERASGSTRPAAFVRTQLIQGDQHQSSVTLTGQLQARFQARLAFRVSGRVVARYVDVGAHVDAGQLLATLDPAEQQADLDAAVAAVAASELRQHVAQTNFERQNTLLASGFTTRVAFDQAQQELRTAESSLETARAQLGTAKDSLAYTELRASAAGVITERHLEVGQVVQAAQPVFTLAQDGERDAVFDVSESMFFKELDRDAVSVSLVANPGITASGPVREVSPAIDPKTLTVRVKVAVENPPAAMTLGSAVSGTAKLRPGSRITLPWTALTASGSRPAVWVVDAATATVVMKPVKIADYEAGLVVIEQGLAPGERVVVDGGKLLTAGQYVTYGKDPS